MEEEKEKGTEREDANLVEQLKFLSKGIVILIIVFVLFSLIFFR